MLELYNKLKQYGRVKLNEPLAKHITFKIGGPATFFVTIDETKKLVELLKFLDGKGVAYVILGGGSNTLAKDDGFDGVVIHVNDQRIEIDDDIIIAESGARTVSVAQASMRAGLTGFEWGVGLPGTIGGAVRGNSGAMGGETRDNLLKVCVYRDGEVIEMMNDACEFDYRSSVFKHEGGVILRIYLKLEKALPNSGLMQKALEYLLYRNSTQPQGFASSGCIFKNVNIDIQSSEGSDQFEFVKNHREALLMHFGDDKKVKNFIETGKISAGWLIEQAGLKGRQIGNVQISEKHGNFFLNLRGAMFSDVFCLIEEVKQVVYTKFGIQLEEEVTIF